MPLAVSKMTIVANHFTASVLLSAPRRSSGVPSPDGKQALYTVSTYDFEKHEKRSEIRLLDLGNGESRTLTTDQKASEPNWIGDSSNAVWLLSGDKGTTELVGIRLEEEKVTEYVPSTYQLPVRRFA
jgi:dipeptidyl aminopeptidase/acylaminoacyl peptidase